MLGGWRNVYAKQTGVAHGYFSFSRQLGAWETCRRVISKLGKGGGMAIYEIGANGFSEVPYVSFEELKLKERDDIQRALRESISAITPGTETMVLAEEFGNWEDSRRRIDLLCLDSDANLVVVELKRTENGGHMELQALRYAAMVSAMKFEQAVEAHRIYRRQLGMPEEGAEAAIRSFLGVEDVGAVAFTNKVRIVLASADFSRELTTAVLWLNTQGSMDIRCVQMRPVKAADRVLLDVQQVIPLPQAAAYQVAIREKSIEQAAAGVADGRDFTKYDVTIGDVVHQGLPKRRFIYVVVAEAIRQGLTPADIGAAIPWRANRLFISAEGVVKGEELAAINGKDPGRFFCAEDQLFHIHGRTYAFLNQWGRRTEEAVKNVLAAMPDSGQVDYCIAE